ncbi:MAG: hypothetical protein M1818_005430 [Claussenomyces sp. TS43310]|nr:MAG: hypothetical protein M1818_005430 [Claussenomyces sp. TS43310]
MVKSIPKRRSKDDGASLVQHDLDLPAFDKNVLSELTDKIDQGFRNGKASKTEAGHKDTFPCEERTKTVGPISTRHKISTQVAHTGKKRDSGGIVKQASNRSSDMTWQQPKKGATYKATLLKEVLTLGGTEEDLDLIADFDSDDEDLDLLPSSSATNDSKLAADLSSFVSGLGISRRIIAETYNSELEGGEKDGSEDVNTSLVNERFVATRVAPVNEKNLEKGRKELNHLVFQARPDWHAADLPPLPLPNRIDSTPYRKAITELKDCAKSLLEADSNLYTSKHLSSTSSHRFLGTIMSSGTLSDKISALTLVVQESPVHTTKSFESLLGLAKKRSRGQAVSALGAMKDLLGSGVVLPGDRRLRYFADQPGLLGALQAEDTWKWTLGGPLPGNITEAHLISWAYEDWLKESYFEMLKVLESWCNDEVEFARQRAVTYVYELLREKPEQESNLLKLLINKLGDPERKIASRASYLILQLQTTHPVMKPIIIQAIENELLLRPNQSPHALYYAINTLNQTILSGKESEVAGKLLSIYFGLFVTLLRRPSKPKVLVGQVVNKNGQVQGGGGQIGKRAKEKVRKEDLAKRASQETTDKLISAILTGVNRAFPFAGSDDVTLEKHIDMLFKITHSTNFNTSIQALMLIQQLVVLRGIAVDRFYRTLYESLLDPRLITSSKHALYLNLLFRALKADLNSRRVKAFAKRLVQVITLHQPPFICGVLYLLRELDITFPRLISLLNDPEEHDGSQDETFRDVPEITETRETMLMPMDAQGFQSYPVEDADSNAKQSQYDGRRRDPEHSNADKSCLWELLPFLAHFHPSVSMFAKHLLQATEMPAKPDLTSHTLIHFLDRFVYKNAKAGGGRLRGSSIMQPLAGSDSRGVLVSNRPSQQNEPVNSETFWHKKVEDIAVDEIFFHKYFSQVGKSEQSAARKVERREEPADSSTDDNDGEDEVWQALVQSRPEVEGDSSEDDSDLEMLDLIDVGDESGSESGATSSSDEDVDVDSVPLRIDARSSLHEGSDTFDGEEVDLSDENDLFSRELRLPQSVQSRNKTDETRASKKRRMKSLPIFASVEDYAAILGADDKEDM